MMSTIILQMRSLINGCTGLVFSRFCAEYTVALFCPIMIMGKVAEGGEIYGRTAWHFC